MKLLWLASWYPNKYEPYNGDFIQRHAQAVSEHLPVDVIHVVQLGKDGVAKDEEEIRTEGQLREFIHYFSFKKWGIDLIDKIRYNYRYLRVADKAIRNYAAKYGQPDLMHVHVPIKAGILARRFARRWKIPFLVSEQASYYEDAAPHPFPQRSYFFRSNSRKIFRDAAAVTNVSATIGEKIRQMFDLPKVVTVHNVVDPEQFFYDGFPAGNDFCWLHVSAMNEQKNIEGMFRAFALLNKKQQNWRLTVVGPDQPHHHALARELQLADKITFAGEVPHVQVAGFMRRAHAFVLFSRHENFPCVIVEALCSGLPVIAANVGGVQEAVHPENGCIVQSGNIDQLAREMQALMMNYHHFNAGQIQKEAVSRYGKNVIARQFIAVYQEVMAARHTVG